MAPKIPPKKTFKEQAKVLFQYTAENEDELTIKEGDIINIISKQIEDKGWMKGELNGKIGVFPDNFVEILPSISQSNQTTNNFQKSSTNNFINNGTNDSPPKLPATKKPIPETKLSKVITSKFNEIISKSNNSINEITSTPKSSLFNLTTKQTDDSLNKSTINQAPSLPVKKTKLFTTPKPSFHQRESSEENLDKQDDLNSFIDEPNNLSPIKLTHLTANRNKGPSRRPPSIIQIPKDDESSLTSSNSLSNLTDLNDNKNFDDQLNKELNNKLNNKTPETMLSKTTTTTTNQPPWMLELKKTQAEKKNVEVGKMKKNFSLTDETNTSTSNFNGNSPNSSKKSINQSPNSPTKLTNTPITATPFNHRMSGDYTSRFKEFLQQQPTIQNSTNVNSLSRHSSVNNHHNFNSSRTLSTDSLDCKAEQTNSLGFGNLTSPFKPIKAAKPTTVNKFISGSPTTNNFLSNSNLNNSTNNQSVNNQSVNNQSTNNQSTNNQSINNQSTNNQSVNNNQINKDLVSRKEFDELQKRVNDLTDIVENQKQIYKGLVTDLINDIAEEKKKVANLSIEVDRLRKLTTTV